MSQTNSAGPYLDDRVNQHVMSLKTYKLEKLITIRKKILKQSTD